MIKCTVALQLVRLSETATWPVRLCCLHMEGGASFIYIFGGEKQCPVVDSLWAMILNVYCTVRTFSYLHVWTVLWVALQFPNSPLLQLTKLLGLIQYHFRIAYQSASVSCSLQLSQNTVLFLWIVSCSISVWNIIIPNIKTQIPNIL